MCHAWPIPFAPRPVSVACSAPISRSWFSTSPSRARISPHSEGDRFTTSFRCFSMADTRSHSCVCPCPLPPSAMRVSTSSKRAERCPSRSLLSVFPSMRSSSPSILSRSTTHAGSGLAERRPVSCPVPSFCSLRLSSSPSMRCASCIHTSPRLWLSCCCFCISSMRCASSDSRAPSTGDDPPDREAILSSHFSFMVSTHPSSLCWCSLTRSSRSAMVPRRCCSRAGDPLCTGEVAICTPASTASMRPPKSSNIVCSEFSSFRRRDVTPSTARAKEAVRAAISRCRVVSTRSISPRISAASPSTRRCAVSSLSRVAVCMRSRPVTTSRSTVHNGNALISTPGAHCNLASARSRATVIPHPPHHPSPNEVQRLL
eukprot:Sspe_Gene.27817::Locus_12205_Transcript_1_1_Confidence_1.000_Length_1559::g.27817::m.27817